MSHTLKFGATTFFFSGDFSGNVTITHTDEEEASLDEVEIPFEDLKSFMAEYVRRMTIRTVENMSADELLLGY